MRGSARQFRIRRSLVALAVAACFAAEIAHANPVGPVVVNGQVSFARSGSLLTVTNSPSSIINWQQFSIGAGEATRFIQQSAASAVLNRVVTSDPSSILGALQSNGRVFLINPNGIVFGAGARIDVSSLVASTLQLSNEDFLAGRLRFAGDPAKAAAVVNHGRITAAEGGRVYLIGAAVDNQGVITAPNGEVVLAAGNSVRVTESPGSRLQVEITAPADGAVNLSEAVYGSRGVYGGLVRNSGTINADSAVRTADGRIILKASNDVRLEATSRITANGAQGGSVTAQAEGGTLLADGAIEATGSDGKGGTVELLGERVGLVNAARVDASGTTGGGTVLVGGDYQGRNPDVQNAQRAYVGPGASIRADATHEGDGGKVVVWADGDTRYYGEISARGGVEGGDGGFVEVSGKQYLDFHGKVDVSAPQGEGGRVLLDPQDIVLNTTVQPSPPNNAIGTPDVAFADPPDPGTYTIQIADVTGYAELFLQATNDITVNNALTMGAGNTIRFEADNNITINAAVTTTGTPSTARPSITLTADADASGAGTLAVNAGLNSDIGGITLSGASITGAGAINSTGGAAQNGGDVTITAAGVVNLTGAITATGGAAGGAIGRSGGTVSITGTGVTTGAITANGTAGAAGFAGGAGGTIQIDSTNGITTGNLQATGAAGGAGSVSGGAGGTIDITNNAAGNIATGNLTARAGAGTGTALSNPGSITVTNNVAGASLQTGAIDTRGNNNGAGGAVTLSSQGALQFNAGATILTSGGGAVAGTSGQNGGAVTLTGDTVTTTGAITTSGAAGNGANQAGGNAGAIMVTANGAIDVSGGALAASGGAGGTAAGAGGAGGNAGSISITTTGDVTTAALTASGGAGGAGGGAGASGGDAGSISVANTSSTTGNVATGALTAVSGNAVGGGAAGAAGSITVTNDNATAGATLATGAINVNGGLRGAGGSVVLDSESDVSVTGTIQASGGGAAVGGTHAGANGGTVTITGVNRSVSGNITASGGVGAGTDQAGGNAGIVSLTGTGTLNTAGITVSTGGATGVGAGGTAGSITLAGSAVTSGALTTTGGANGAGGTVSATSSAGLLNVGAITASGGAANAGTAGNGAGTVTLTSADTLTATTITASGSGGNGANQVGGAGGVIQLDSTNGVTTTALAASGGASGAGGSASGGVSGTIAITNNTAGNISTGTLTARAGVGTGTALSNPGTITVTNSVAGGSLQTGAIDTRGNNNGAGGAVTLSSQGALQFSAGATIQTSGGGALAGTPGQSGGAVTLTGDTVTTTGAITTSGAAGNGANQAGGNAGAIMVTANGSIDVSAGALTAIGGNAGGGNADGGNGGAVNLDAGAASTITHANITTTGGNRAGTGTAGAGGNITIADAALLGANTTITATGGSAGIGAGGDVTFSGTLDSSGASRTLAVNTNGSTVFGDAVGSTLALTSLTTNATGTTSIGGDVTTTGAQSYGDVVTLTGNATLTGTTPTFSSTVNGGGFDLALDFSLITTINGANFSNINNLSTGNGGTTQLTGAITTAGSQSYGDAVTLTGATTLASTGNQAIAFGGTVNGAQTLAVNTTGATTFSGVVGGVTALTGLTTNAGGTTSIGANISTNNAVVSLGDAVTLTGPSTISSGTGAVTFGTTVDGASALTVNSTGATTFTGAVGGVTPLASLTTNAGGTTAINGGAVITTGAQTYNDALTLGGATTLRTTAGGAISANAAVTATAGMLTLDTGSGAATFNNVANDFGTVAITSGGTVSLVDANALTLAGASVDSIQAQTLSGNLTVSAGITAAGAGNSIVLAAAADFVNSVGAGALNPGPGRWLVYSTSPAGSTENGLTGAAGSALPRLYNRTFGGNPPASITEPGNHLIYSAQPTLTVTPDNKVKVYGADDPAQTFVAVGFVNDDGVLDTAATAGLGGSFARAVGESVGARAITQGMFTSNAGYAISFTGGQTLSINAANVQATVTQSKTYGANDPALPFAATSLTGLVNNPAIVTWNGVVSIDDSALTSNATALTRAVGEGVGVRAITAGTFTAPSGNYNAPTLAGGSTLTINPANLTATVTQSKTYGANDPALPFAATSLAGLVNNPAIVTWNGVVSIDDSALTSNATSLTRAVGEGVGVRAITAGTFTAPSANYNAPTLAGGSTLTINAAPLSFALATPGQAKVYGADDPALGGIGVTLTGLVNNPAIATWNGAASVNDSAVTGTLTSLTRAAGETVAGSPYAITAGAVTLSASDANYVKSLDATNSPALTITSRALTGTIANQAKAYGADDPALAGIGVTLAGVVNNPAIVTWNGNVGVNDTGNVTASLASLTRTAGEVVAGSPYAITGGTLNALGGAAAGSYTASLSTAGNTLTVTPAPLTAMIANQAKAYGADDPALGGIGVTLGGLVNNPTIVTWNGNVGINDSALTSSVTSLTRMAGENVGSYNVTAGTFTAASANYSAPTLTGTPTLAINPAPLTFALTTPGQTKVYGADDPALGSMAVTLTGLVNNPAIATWNGAASVNDSAVTGTLTSLTRTAGESVAASPYAITAGTVTLSASNANYTRSFDATNSPQLAVTPRALTGTIANQAKAYGTNDPALAGIAVNLGGVVNNPAIVTWNGTVGVNDTGNVTTSLASLARVAGETVAAPGPTYAITGGTLNALGGSAAGNYTASLSTAGNTLTINPAALTATVANQSKGYGANDPALGGIGVTLGGLVNASVTDWNSNVTAINDTALTSSVTSLTRVVGENVGVRAITAGTFTTPSANYNAPTLAGGSTLTITQAALTFALTTPGQTKVYGVDDPALGGIGVTLTGLINNPAILTWNGAASVNDSAVTGTLTSLTRAVGETVAASPYAITAGAVTLSASDANYAKSFDASNNPTLALTQVPVSVTANAQSKTYGAADPALTYGVAGLVTAMVTDWNSNSTSITDTVASVMSGGLTRAPGEAVAGSPYAINQGTLAANANYGIATFTGNNLTITTAPLTITANNATRPVNQPDPPFSAAYSGFQFGETPAVLTGALSLTTTAIMTSPPGPYPITPSGQSSTNYTISYVDGTLQVTAGISLPPTGIPNGVTNLVVGGLQQLGNGAANGDAGMCSGSNRPYGSELLTSVGAWSLGICATRDLEPVRLVAVPVARDAPPVLAAEPAPTPAPEMSAALPTDMPAALPPVAEPAQKPAAAVAAAPRQAEPRDDRVTTTVAPSLALRMAPRELKYNDVMTAVMFLDLAAVAELLDLGWWVDRPDSRGRSPLMGAALNGDVAMTRLLLQRGADPSRRAPDGSVLDHARKGGNAEVIELLLRAGAQ